MTEIELDLSLHPRQLEAYESEGTEKLFGGATEGGKSHYARCLLISACLAVPHLMCVLIRKKYSDISDNHVEGRTGFKSLLEPLVKLGIVHITKEGVFFKNGSNITFKHCQDERQFISAQGIEVHLLVIDEATQISERLIRFFRTWVRMPKEMRATLPDEWKDKLPQILYTANPIGVSVPFFKRKFVDARPHEAVELVEGFKRQYMLSRYTDNPSVDEAAHKGRLEGIGDAAVAQALDLGDWNALTGEFYPEWDEDRHVIQDFTPPSHWFRYRSFDWGMAEPAAVYWIAISDGEPFRDENGDERWFPRGALIVYDEWYLCDLESPEKGIRMRNEDIASGIVSRSELGYTDLITLADSKPFQDTGGDGIALTFQKNGCTLTRADTSRVAGWSQLRSRLIGISHEVGSAVKIPMIFFCEKCKYARDYIPALPRHPSESKKEDAAEHGEATHACDAIRYACMAHANAVIKDRLQPMESRIMRELSQKPTMKKITSRMGNVYFT